LPSKLGGVRTRFAALFVCAAASLAAVPAALAADDPLLAPIGACIAGDQLILDAATAQQSMLCLTNYARTQSGLPALQLDATLNEAGQAKLAADIACGEFSHTPCGNPFSTVFGTYLTGARGYQIGENIAWGTGTYGTPRSTMNGWLHSEGHRANILTAAYRDLGVGYIPNQLFQGYSGAALWSQQFGTRTPTAQPTQTQAVQTPAVQTQAASTATKKKSSRKRYDAGHR
jgi:hypothetical protein